MSVGNKQWGWEADQLDRAELQAQSRGSMIPNNSRSQYRLCDDYRATYTKALLETSKVNNDRAWFVLGHCQAKQVSSYVRWISFCQTGLVCPCQRSWYQTIHQGTVLRMVLSPFPSFSDVEGMKGLLYIGNTETKGFSHFYIWNSVNT